jgi:hypothetical protein
MLRAGHVTQELEEKIEKAFAVHYFFGSWTPQTAENKDNYPHHQNISL